MAGKILFLGHPTAGSFDRALYAVAPDGGSPRLIGAVSTNESDPTIPDVTPTKIGFQDLQQSSDGKSIAYWSWDTSQPHVYTHVRDLDTGVDTAIAMVQPYDDATILPHFSPDGRSLLFERQTSSTSRLVVRPLDGSGPDILLGPTFTYEDTRHFDFSPDGTKVILTLGDPGVTWIMDATGGLGEKTNEVIPSFPNWQRLAPAG